MKKRFYIVFVSRDADGSLSKVPVPLHFMYIFVAAAVIGMFTIAGMAGSYSRMLLKTARFNQMRQDQNNLRKDYARLEQAARQKDVQAASLGALAGEVSALYGLTVNKFTGHAPKALASVADVKAPLVDTAAPATDASLSRSQDDLYALRTSALSGTANRIINGNYGDTLPLRSGMDLLSGINLLADAPTLWPVMGPITSSFGQREDPILGTGEGEFHKGIDISAPKGTPIHATADGTVTFAAFGNGYGREVEIDHGNGIKTIYGHMSAFAVMDGAHISRGQVIGYVGSTGRTTGNHVHYEVRIHNIAVNPHKYLRETLGSLGTLASR